MRFPRQEYWSGLPCPSPGDLPEPGMGPKCPALQVDSFPSEPPGKPGSLDAQSGSGTQNVKNHMGRGEAVFPTSARSVAFLEEGSQETQTQGCFAGGQRPRCIFAVLEDQLGEDCTPGASPWVISLALHSGQHWSPKSTKHITKMPISSAQPRPQSSGSPPCPSNSAPGTGQAKGRLGPLAEGLAQRAVAEWQFPMTKKPGSSTNCNLFLSILDTSCGLSPNKQKF